jgi:hypothetical protein
VVYHEPKSPFALNRAAGREMSAICMKALQKSPRERYPSAMEMAEDIRRARQFLPVSVLNPRLVDKVGRWARRHRVAASVLGTLLGVGLLVAGIVGFETWREHSTLAQASARLNVEQAEFADLKNQIDSLKERSSLLLSDDPERTRLIEQIADLTAEKRVLRWNIHGLITAMVGFTFFSPDDDLLATARAETWDIIRTTMEEGELATTQVFLRNTLARIHRNNVFRFSDNDILEMERTLVQVSY